MFAAYRIDEQLAKALDRKVWLPSGGSLVIDRTEAMTVVDVNTGKFTGQGGNLEETVTRNNLEAAEELVRQLRLRDVGGIVVIDFIDMVLESNRELVLRRLLECLARDRTKHQVAEVTSLGLVQMTRKRVGAGLLEAFSQQCECCNGRGVIVALDAPAEPAHRASAGTGHRPVPTPPSHAPGNGNGKGQGNGAGGGRGGGGSANGRRGRPPGRPRRHRARQRRARRPPAARRHPAADRHAVARRRRQRAGRQAGTAADVSGAPRTRRSTAAAGRAFATAVLVDDEPALVPVVPTVPPVTEPAAAATATAGDTATDAPPVRRTRAGSAVARVTVTSDPQPPAEPDTAAAAADAPAPATDEAAPEATDEAAPADGGPRAPGRRAALPADERHPGPSRSPRRPRSPGRRSSRRASSRRCPPASSLSPSRQRTAPQPKRSPPTRSPPTTPPPRRRSQAAEAAPAAEPEAEA